MTMIRRLMTATLALGAAALLGLVVDQARADDPAPFAHLPAGPAPAAPQPDITTRATPAAPPTAAQVVVSPAPPACAPVCDATCLKKVCVPETAVRTIDRRVYGDTCEDFCVPRCSHFGGLSLFGRHKHDDCGACDSGSCASCEHRVRQKKYLVVKIRHEEECYTKCNVGYAPPCQHGTCEAPSCCAGATVTPMPPVEKVPAPKERK